MKKKQNQSCSHCHGNRIVIDPISGDYAQAEFCRCFPSPCPACGDTRFCLEQDGLGRELAVSCPECEGRLRHIHLYNRARIPKNYGLGRLDRTEKDKHNGNTYNMLTSIINIKANPEQSAVRHNGLVLMGAPGTGKTYLMAGFVYQCTINHGISCMFRPFDKLLSELKEGYATGKSEMETIAPLLEADFLIIDDLGKGRNTEWELNILDTLITERYNSNNRIMVTSNHTEKEETTIKERLLSKNRGEEERYISDTLRKRVGERIYSRLREMCYFETLTGPDRREMLSEVSRTTEGTT